MVLGDQEPGDTIAAPARLARKGKHHGLLMQSLNALINVKEMNGTLSMVAEINGKASLCPQV